MTKKRLLPVVMAFATLAFGLHLQAQTTPQCSITTFPWSENFTDTGSLSCWLIVDGNSSASDDWHFDDNLGFGDSTAVTALQGSPSNEWLVMPAITVPASAANLKLQWHVRGEGYYGFYNPYYEVRVSPTGSTDVDDFTDTLFSETYSGSWATRSTMLDAYAGQTIRVAFHYTANYAESLSLDAFSIDYANAPVYSISGAQRIVIPDTLHLTSTRIEGLETGLTRTWTSRMASAGQASLIAQDSVAHLIYTAGGIDTITLIASNSYGSDTVTHVVTVVSCAPISDFPYAEGFESEIDCWQFVAGNGIEANNWARYSSNQYAHTGRGVLLGRYNDTVDMDHWAISPAFVVPSDATGLTLFYYVRGSVSGNVSNHYQVRVSTSGTALADFADTLLDETITNGYVLRNLPLDTYAGQTIRLAFHNITPADGNNLFIDDFEVRFANLPVYSIEGATTAISGETTTFNAIRTEGNTTNLVYQWHSVMAADGQATLTNNGTSADIVYATAGNDTLTLVVTNNYGSDTALLFVNVVNCFPIDSLPFFEGFEADVNCWKFVSNNGNSSDDWSTYTSSRYAHGGSTLLLGRYNNEVDCDDWAISPAVVIPSNAAGLTLNYYVRGSEDGGIQSHYQVLASTSGSALSAFNLLLDDSLNTGYVARNLSLSDFGGDTIRIAFRNLTAAGGSNMFIDDIEIRFANDPVYSLVAPTQAEVNEPVELTANRIEGDTTNLTFEWYSVMATDGQATLTPDGAQAQLVYTAVGIDTVTFIVTNNFGSDTLTQAIEVISCDPISEFPFKEDFESAVNCWRYVDNNGWSVDDWTVYQSSNYSFSGTHMLLGHYNDDADVDDWAITPAFAIPDDAEGFNFSYYVRGSSYDGIPTHYEVRLSSTGTALDDFSTVLLDDSLTTGYERRVLSMEEYAGQTIRIAFRNLTRANGNNMMIDDVEMRFANAPVYELVGPTSANAEDTVNLEANYIEGVVEGTTFSWSSSMAEAGQATLTATDLNAQLTYTTAGTDVVTFIATNRFGSDTLQHTIEVYECNTISTFPYFEDFEDNALCWSIVSANGRPEDDWRLGSNRGANSGDYSFIGYYNDNYEVDDWLISPAIALPNSDSISLGWYFSGTDNSNLKSTYQVLVSTSGSDISTFDSIYGEAAGTNNTFEEREVSLAAYAGKTVRIAFRNLTPQGGFIMQIDDVTITVGETNAIERAESQHQVSIYPNPASSKVRISVAESGNVQISIHDLSGRTVLQRDGNGPNHTIDISDLPKGAYFVRLVGTGWSEVRKLIVQ